ncbi:MAG: DUF3796 domain-containing protein [Saccharofermentanales bacterium]
MKNKLGFIGLIGFLGFSGILTDNRYLLAFFGFFVFFRYFFVKPDELFALNVQKAAVPAFFTGVAIQTLTIAIISFTKDKNQLIFGLTLSFSISVFIFILKLVIAEFNEYRSR